MITVSPLEWPSADGPFRASRTVEAVRVEDDGTLTLGWRAGPSEEAGNLLHEMAHLLEIDDRRLGKPGWGLKVAKVVILGRPYIEPRTFQCTLREIRVMGRQKVLHEAAGIPFDTLHWAGLWPWFPDHYMAFSHYGREIGKTKEAEITELVARDIDAEAAQWTIEALKAEWDRKVTLYRKRLKKRPRA